MASSVHENVTGHVVNTTNFVYARPKSVFCCVGGVKERGREREREKEREGWQCCVSSLWL